MINGQQTWNELAKANKNVLNNFCNFNDYYEWNTPTGGANATIITNITGLKSYYGEGAVGLNFTGTGEVSFNTGNDLLESTVTRTGMYTLSYAFFKENTTSNINFIVEMYVNGVLQPNNTITQTLHSSLGFVNDKWNLFYQNVFLVADDVVDFAFKATSNTTACYLYFDRLKLELANKGSGLPTMYSEGGIPELSMFAFDFNHGGTPQTYVSGTMVLDNDGAGVNTNTQFIPYQHQAIYSTTTNEFSFRTLALGDAVMIRLNINVTTTSANQTVSAYLELGQGVSPYRVYFQSNKLIKNIGTYTDVTVDARVTMLNEMTLLQPAQFKFESDDDATITVNGYNVTVLTTS